MHGFLLYHSPPGAPVQNITTPVLASPFAQSSGPTYRGPSPVVHLAHSDPFARARIAAVQSRVAAPRPPPPVPVFSPFRDGHYWCSKCPRRGFTTIPGLMRHVTHQHAGSSVDEATWSLFRRDRTSHLHGSLLWWPQKNGCSDLQQMWAS